MGRGSPAAGDEKVRIVVILADGELQISLEHSARRVSQVRMQLPGNIHRNLFMAFARADHRVEIAVDELVTHILVVLEREVLFKRQTGQCCG